MEITFEKLKELVSEYVDSKNEGAEMTLSMLAVLMTMNSDVEIKKQIKNHCLTDQGIPNEKRIVLAHLCGMTM